MRDPLSARGLWLVAGLTAVALSLFVVAVYVVAWGFCR